jgi:hypothetical protein
MSYLENLTAEDLDQIERDVSERSSLVWDQICWANDADKKSELRKQLTELQEELEEVYAARAEIIARQRSAFFKKIRASK